jgi:hypothetical protein
MKKRRRGFAKGDRPAYIPPWDPESPCVLILRKKGEPCELR